MDQQATIDLLDDPATHGGAAVETITTHISHVVLAGDRAYKLKRAVRYAFVDFSTPERRRAACEAEVRINRRSAPDLYLGVAPIVADGDRLRLGAIGEDRDAVDWVVIMRRFDQGALLDRIAVRSGVDADLAGALADAVVHLHEAAEVVRDHDAAATLAWVIDDNAAEFVAMPAVFDPAATRQLTADLHTRLVAARPLLEGRRRAGYVRRCHGDLHLGNLVLLDGRPTPFDAIEFDDRLAVIDTAYDLAFLLMDLEHRGLRAAANIVFNRYVWPADDGTLVQLLPLVLALRAMVRAKVTALAGRVAEARTYARLACAFRAPPPARMVAIGGLSGTGKTTLARAIAPTLGAAPGALIVRTDVLRKRLAWVAETDRLPPTAYAPEMTARVYASLEAWSLGALAAGHGVVADAVFARPAERAGIERVAAEVATPFVGFWLEADAAALTGRVAGRTGDASDADAGVVALQTAYDVGDIRWHRIDGGQPPERVAADAGAILGREEAAWRRSGTT